jgi:hypothetical protein
VIDVKRITNKKSIKKTKTKQNDISTTEIIEKIDTTLNTVQNIQNSIPDKETIRKLSDDNQKSVKEIIEKIDTTLNTVQNIQNSIPDKETIRKLSDDIKKSVIVNYAGLSIVYLGIGLALLLASLKLIAIQYSIIFGLFFGGSILLAYLAYIRKKELHK